MQNSTIKCNNKISLHNGTSATTITTTITTTTTTTTYYYLHGHRKESKIDNCWRQTHLPCSSSDEPQVDVQMVCYVLC